MSQFVTNNMSTWNSSSNQLQNLGQSVLSQGGNVSINNSSTSMTIPAQLSYGLHHHQQQQQQQQLTPGVGVGALSVVTAHAGVATNQSSVAAGVTGGTSLIGLPPAAAAAQQYKQQQLFQSQQQQPQQQQQSTIAVGVSGGGGGGLMAPAAIQHVTPAEMAAATSLISALGKHVTQNTQASVQQQQQAKHRVFTGAISMLQDTFGFVDNDVFFKTSCVKGGVPRLGDRVLVDCQFNANMPFKWNADRVQILPSGKTGAKRNLSTANSTSAVVVGGGINKKSNNGAGGAKPASARASVSGDSRLPHSGRPRSPLRRPVQKAPRPRKRDDDKRDSNSPRRRARPAPRYSIRLPRHVLSLRQAHVLELTQRYSNLYIPSDFVEARFFHNNIFPLHQPFKVTSEVSYHVLDKESGVPEPHRSVYEADDANYSYSAKVMLLSTPSWLTLCQRAIPQLMDKGDSNGTSSDSSSDGEPQHPARGIGFLVGLRGKNETMAIGGAWSPSLDGSNPASDPHVLIRTATRTCHALTGIDLSRCTKWWRLAEIVYRRSERSTEIVVLFMPDTRALMPSCVDWHTGAGAMPSTTAQTDRSTLVSDAMTAPLVAADTTTDADDSSVLCEAAEESDIADTDVGVDPRNMKVSELRQELECRNLSPKGLKSQLIARLVKVLKAERSDSICSSADTSLTSAAIAAADIAESGGQREGPAAGAAADGGTTTKVSGALDGSESADCQGTGSEPTLKLPDKPCVLVYPCRTAKSGKFDCAVISLSVLLDYRHDDKKEHSFEVSLFAEIFNEMLLRDAAFNIFHSLYDMKDKEKSERDTGKSSKDDQKSDKEDSGDKKMESGGEAAKSSNSVVSADKTMDTEFLMSFAYFDTGHCEYITVRDLEQIVLLTGLQLSRSQCRRLVQRVCGEKDTSVYYRKVGATNRPTSALEIVSKYGYKTASSSASDDIKGDETAKSGVVEYQGSLVDVTSLMERLSKVDCCLEKTEQRLTETLRDNESLRQQYTASEKAADSQRCLLSAAERRASALKQQLDDTSDILRTYRQAVDTVFTACSSLCSGEKKEQKTTTTTVAVPGGGKKDETKTALKSEDKKADVHGAAEKEETDSSVVPPTGDSTPTAKRARRG